MSEIGENLKLVKKALPPDVCLVAVSKFHPVEDIVEAYNAGQRVFGESRPQEFRSKVEYISSLNFPEPVVWHFIGHLQTNKLKMVLPYADVVESVDSVELLNAIEKWAAEHPCYDGSPRVIKVLIELHIASEQTKLGFAPDEAYKLLSGESSWPHIRFCGLMGMATFTDDMSTVRSDFGRLTGLFARLHPLIGKCPCLTESFREMSFGMSEDYPVAIEMGATIVRVGTAIFGPRPRITTD